jgi:hypothetical protein
MANDFAHRAWRRRLLERAGFPRVLARAVARDDRVDIHSLLELVERGCEPTTAVRLAALAPERRPS